MIDVIKNNIKIDLQGDTIIDLEYSIRDIGRQLDMLNNTIAVMNSVYHLCDYRTNHIEFVSECNVLLEKLHNIDAKEEQIKKLTNILKESE